MRMNEKQKRKNNDYYGYNSYIDQNGQRVRRVRRTQLSAQKLRTCRSKSQHHYYSNRGKQIKQYKYQDINRNYNKSIYNRSYSSSNLQQQEQIDNKNKNGVNGNHLKSSYKNSINNDNNQNPYLLIDKTNKQHNNHNQNINSNNYQTKRTKVQKNVKKRNEQNQDYHNQYLLNHYNNINIPNKPKNHLIASSNNTFKDNNNALKRSNSDALIKVKSKIKQDKNINNNNKQRKINRNQLINITNSNQFKDSNNKLIQNNKHIKQPNRFNQQQKLTKTDQSNIRFLKNKYDTFNSTHKNSTDNFKFTNNINSKTGHFRKDFKQSSSVNNFNLNTKHQRKDRTNSGVNYDLVQKIAINKITKTQQENLSDIDHIILNRQLQISHLSQKKDIVQNQYLLKNHKNTPKISLKKRQNNNSNLLSVQKSQKSLSLMENLTNYIQQKQQQSQDFVATQKQQSNSSKQENINCQQIPVPSNIIQSKIGLQEAKQSNIISKVLQSSNQCNQLKSKMSNQKSVFNQKKQSVLARLNPSHLQFKKNKFHNDPSKLSNLDDLTKKQSRISKLKKNMTTQGKQQNKISDKLITFKNLPLDSKNEFNSKGSQVFSKSILSKRSKNFNLQKQGNQLTSLDKIESHQLIIAYIQQFIETTKQFYGEQISKDTQKLNFLLLKKVYLEKGKFNKAIKKNGRNCFNLSGISIEDKQLEKIQNSKEVQQKIKYSQSELKQLFKNIEKQFKLIKAHFQNDCNIKVQTPIDDFSNEIVLLLFQQLNQLYPQLQNLDPDGSQMCTQQDRIIQLIELIFLMSQFKGRKIKQFQLSYQVQDFQEYYEKYYQKMVETLQFFQIQLS